MKRRTRQPVAPSRVGDRDFGFIDRSVYAARSLEEFALENVYMGILAFSCNIWIREETEESTRPTQLELSVVALYLLCTFCNSYADSLPNSKSILSQIISPYCSSFRTEKMLDQAIKFLMSSWDQNQEHCKCVEVRMHQSFGLFSAITQIWFSFLVASHLFIAKFS